MVKHEVGKAGNYKDILLLKTNIQRIIVQQS